MEKVWGGVSGRPAHTGAKTMGHPFQNAAAVSPVLAPDFLPLGDREPACRRPRHREALSAWARGAAAGPSRLRWEEKGVRWRTGDSAQEGAGGVGARLK